MKLYTKAFRLDYWHADLDVSVGRRGRGVKRTKRRLKRLASKARRRDAVTEMARRLAEENGDPRR